MEEKQLRVIIASEKHAAALYNFKDFNHCTDKSPWEQQDTHIHTLTQLSCEQSDTDTV